MKRIRITEIIMHLLFCLSILFHSGHSLIGYDCSDSNSLYTELSVIDTSPCKPHERNITKEDTWIQLIQPRTFDQSPYIQCLVEIDHFIFRCGKTIDTNVASSRYSEFYDLTKIECETIINEGIFTYEGVKIRTNKALGLYTVSIETIGSINGGSCEPGMPTTLHGIFHDRPVRNSVFKIKTYKGVASVDLEESKIILESGLKCNYLNNNCFSANEGNVFWDSKFNQPTCDGKEFIAIYEGQATHIKEYLNGKVTESYLLHYEKYDFQVILTNKITRTCGQVSYLTEHPKLSVIKQEHNLPFTLKYHPNTLDKNTNLFTYVNSKLVYAMSHVKDQIENLYNKIMYDKCQSDNKIIHNMMTLAVLSPHQFAYQYYGEEGFTANQRGEVIYVVKCQPVVVNFTQNVNQICYQEIPVNYNGKELFMSPRSRLLHKEGTIVECSSIMPVKYRLNNNWYSITPGGIMSSSLPRFMSIESSDGWVFENIDNFASAGVYTPEDLDKIEKIMLAPLNHNAITTKLVRSSTGNGPLTGSASITNMMTPEELVNFGKNEFERFWGNLFQKLGAFGNYVSALIGITMILKSIMFIINPIINFRAMYETLGLTWKLIFIWWENLVHHFLRESEKPKIKTYKKEKDEELGVMIKRDIILEKDF